MGQTQLDSIFRNSSHVRVLRALCRMPEGLTVSGREAARRAGVAHPTASKALTEIAETGLLTVSRAPRSDAYAINRVHYLARAIANLFEAEADTVAQLAAFLTSALDGLKCVDSAALFGSVVSGDAEPGSDVDLVVHCPGSDSEHIESALEALADRTRQVFGRDLGYVFSTRVRRPTRGAWSEAATHGLRLIEGEKAQAC